jgi:hemolysin activation/secretion protein
MVQSSAVALSRCDQPRTIAHLSRLHSLQLGLVALACLVASAASAQPVDAGRVYDSLQQRQPRAVQPQAPSVKQAPSQTPSSSMPSSAAQLEVKAFRIEGAQYLALPRLEAVVQPYAGKTLSVSQLQEAADAITQAYRDAGYSLAQAVVLPQTIQNGVVTITVREGRLERLDVGPAAGATSVPGAAQRGLQQSMRVGEPVNTIELEQTLLLINNLPGGGRASAEIAGTAQPDASLVSASYASARRFAGNIGLDNSGSRYTGRARASASLFINEPASAGDQLSLFGLTSGDGLQYVQAGYRAPLGLRGVLGASISNFKYDLCCLSPGQISKGEGRNYALDTSYQAILSRSTSLQWFSSLERRELLAQGTTTRDRTVTALTLGARGYWISNAQNSWSLSARGGRADLSANPSDFADDATALRSDGRYSKLNGSYYRAQALGGAWSGYLNARMQANLARNLESSEKFVLGGADGIRAYPSGEGVGDSGWLASAELRYAFGAPGLAAAGFVDLGGVKRFSKNETALVGSIPNRYELGGWGLGLRYDGAAANVLLAVSRPIGSNKGVDANGNNADGEKDGGARAWVSAAWRF